MRTKFIFGMFCCALYFTSLLAQNENNNWYFGSYAGLNFSTNPPTTLTNSAMYSSEGCSTVSDANGNLLFYTDGITIWNKSHQVMANGNGLMGHPSAAQSGLVVKQPGNPNLYYVFTVDVAGGTNGFRYTIVNMSLAAGMGSVTTKNNLLYSPCTEKLTAIKTSNGSDFWLVTHEWGSANFRSYKLTASGVNTVCAISSAGTIHGGNNIQNAVGCMKISPNGQKLGLAISNYPFNIVELFDFNTFNGVVSNQFTLSTSGFVYGVEFSPNSSKFYANQIGLNWANIPCLKQWDLSSNNNTTIANSVQNFSCNSNFQNYGMQLAPNGKIYIVTNNSNALSVINNPDLPGAACGFSMLAQPLGSAYALIGLPAFVSMPYTYKSIIANYKNPNCSGAVDFNSPYQFNAVMSNSAVSNYSVLSVFWNFGDITSLNNSAVSFNPSHLYTSAGTYLVQLIIHFSNGVANDTLNSTVSIQNVEPVLEKSSNSPRCEKDQMHFALVTNSVITQFYWTGPNGFSSLNYSNTINTASLPMNGYYQIHGQYGNACPLRDSIFFEVNPIPQMVPHDATVCLQQEIDLIGQGADFYSWYGPQGDSSHLQNYHLQINTLAYAGNYTLTGKSNKGCKASVQLNLFVSALPMLEVNVLPATKVCLNDVLTFITPSQYITEWHGPANFYTNKHTINFWANQLDMSGNYSLTLRNELGCQSNTVIPVLVQNLPELALSGLTNATCPPLKLHYEVLNKSKTMTVSWDVQNNKSSGNYLSYTFQNSGMYFIKAKVFDESSRCSNNFTYVVQVLPKSKAEFDYSPLEPIETLDEVKFHNKLKYDENTKYTWEISNGFNLENAKEPKYTFDNSGYYRVLLSTVNSEGCADTCTKLIKVKANVNLYAPNVFTPNNDNVNEVFKPILYGANAVKLCVFNRWGNKVFESNGEKSEWDGNYMNQACKEDTYYWTFDYVLENNISKTKSGVVLLMR
ncbi:MAG: PKD domain-containing protein [Bacteroidota bacterium]